MQSVVFRSRVDPLLAAVVFVPMLFAASVVLQRAARGQSLGALALGTLVLVFGVVGWCFMATSYRFSDRDLLVRSGPFRVRVPVSQIRRVTRTRSVVAAPALSLRRLEITYAPHAAVVISPRDEAGFLATLKARTPGVELPGGA